MTQGPIPIKSFHRFNDHDPNCIEIVDIVEISASRNHKTIRTSAKSNTSCSTDRPVFRFIKYRYFDIKYRFFWFRLGGAVWACCLTCRCGLTCRCRSATARPTRPNWRPTCTNCNTCTTSAPRRPRLRRRLRWPSTAVRQ